MSVNSTKYDFKAWLETKPSDGKYTFTDSCGHCLMGQFMTSVGESWSMPRYTEYVNEVIGGNTFILNSEPQTFGGALARVRVLEDA